MLAKNSLVNGRLGNIPSTPSDFILSHNSGSLILVLDWRGTVPGLHFCICLNRLTTWQSGFLRVDSPLTDPISSNFQTKISDFPFDTFSPWKVSYAVLLQLSFMPSIFLVIGLYSARSSFLSALLDLLTAILKASELEACLATFRSLARFAFQHGVFWPGLNSKKKIEKKNK
jgi:hypothetical protein